MPSLLILLLQRCEKPSHISKKSVQIVHFFYARKLLLPLFALAPSPSTRLPTHARSHTHVPTHTPARIRTCPHIRALAHTRSGASLSKKVPTFFGIINLFIILSLFLSILAESLAEFSLFASRAPLLVVDNHSLVLSRKCKKPGGIAGGAAAPPSKRPDYQAKSLAAPPALFELPYSPHLTMPLTP